MNELEIIGISIIIIVVIAKCVILIRYISKLTKKNHNKYQKSGILTQSMKKDSKSAIYFALNLQINSKLRYN